MISLNTLLVLVSLVLATAGSAIPTSTLSQRQPESEEIVTSVSTLLISKAAADGTFAAAVSFNISSPGGKPAPLACRAQLPTVWGNKHLMDCNGQTPYQVSLSRSPEKGSEFNVHIYHKRAEQAEAHFGCSYGFVADASEVPASCSGGGSGATGTEEGSTEAKRACTNKRALDSPIELRTTTEATTDGKKGCCPACPGLPVDDPNW
ncbi:hypothetical protein B0H66DRAFT_643760 [Apodospora peruviana]|uniref:AA1-like domain-containing protein n=1 Tax=Apodospora peruviana TaxID=516989 RepID=A0AAE0M0B6_9PEZI|nr:hypothetical protein B0H66DRAFT_643760 [Apodospora peruviana]